MTGEEEGKKRNTWKPEVSNTFTDLSGIVDRESLAVKYQLTSRGLYARLITIPA